MLFDAVALIQVDTLNANSAISVGLMVTILGAAIFLSRSLTRTEEQLRQINEKLTDLGKLPARVASLEHHLSNLETDVNNLWEAFRADDSGHPLDNIRRERGPHRRGEPKPGD